MEPPITAWEAVTLRVLFVSSLIAAAYYVRPFHWSRPESVLLGAALGLVFVFIERWLRRTSLRRLIGAVVGLAIGIVGALMVSYIVSLAAVEKEAASYIHLTLLFSLGYLGLVVGASKGDLLNLAAMGDLFSEERQAGKSSKILDASVVIDGRIADICEAGFIEGTLLLPQFVLRELQQIADSSDPLKRNRGRRGLDILQRMQKMVGIQVQIVDEDFPEIAEFDMKLFELARKHGGKILTNDSNLNKIARSQHVPVLNMNELANALKPIALPGETMRVFILKEGKEFNQGVAYLDDGTMVVVDNARKMISRTIDISVTSALQTAAGKMIFGRYDDRPRAVAASSTPVIPVRPA